MPEPPQFVNNQAPWFDYQDLKDLFPYKKIQNASSATQTYINNVLIKEAINFIQNYTGFFWTVPPDEILLVAERYAVNKILADDENVQIAHARRQPSFTVAGDTVNLDLTVGLNPFLSEEDEVVLTAWRDQSKDGLHVDKVFVKSAGNEYDDAVGRGSRVSEYIRGDGYLLPGYLTGR